MTNEKLAKTKELRKRLSNIGMNIVKADPWVPITLRDGTRYKLEYSFGAVLEVFRETGLNINLGQIQAHQILAQDVFPILLAAGLRTHHAGDPLLVEDGLLLDHVAMRHMLYYAECISQALDAVQPDQEELDAILEELRENAKESVDAPLVPMPISSDSGQDVEIVDVLS